MKTRYILHGGYANHENLDNDKFFQEILNIDKNELNILIVLFAKPEDEREERGENTRKQFDRNNNHKKILNFIIADENNFSEQIKKSDILFLHGGKTLKLFDALQGCSNFEELIRGKVIAGESAGAYVLSACYYSKSLGAFSQGLGLVPVKTICHYTGENREKLKNCSENLAELLLKDYEYKVFTIDK